MRKPQLGLRLQMGEADEREEVEVEQAEVKIVCFLDKK